MPILLLLHWLRSQRLMVPITEGFLCSTTHVRAQNIKTVQPHFSPWKNPKSKQSFVCLQGSLICISTLSSHRKMLQIHTRGKRPMGTQLPNGWDHGLGGTKNPTACLSPAHTLRLLAEHLAGLHWDTSSSQMMWSKMMRKISQMWCSCGQLLLENEVKERTSPPSPSLGKIDTAATYTWSQRSSTTRSSNSHSENRAILDFSVRGLASIFIHRPRCSSS